MVQFLNFSTSRILDALLLIETNLIIKLQNCAMTNFWNQIIRFKKVFSKLTYQIANVCKPLCNAWCVCKKLYTAAIAVVTYVFQPVKRCVMTFFISDTISIVRCFARYLLCATKITMPSIEKCVRNREFWNNHIRIQNRFKWN